MKFVLVFGPPAVGKMTVGHELEKLTGLKLFHNHMTIDLITPFFDYGTPSFQRLLGLFREEIFKEVSTSDLEGIIFTYVWSLDEKCDEEYVDKVVKLFKEVNAEIYYVELEAKLEERLQRNKSDHRLEHKRTKRDVEKSEAGLLEWEGKFRFNTKANEFQRENYLKIDNTNLSAKEVAQQIQKEFGL